jgi:hypothetical protein
MNEFEVTSQTTASSSERVLTVLFVGVIWIWRVLRVSVFFLLYWLRLPVMFLSGLVAVPTMIAWLFSFYVLPQHTFGLGVISFAAFTIQVAYDVLLVWLAPYRVT